MVNIMTYKLGSLFDGSGGFPLAGALCGIQPIWASEVEPYPIAVTKSRFPKMKHLGDIRKINGGQIEPVDIITFGSPCQDLSMAGKRKGLKHTDLDNEENTRSGLFMEAVRIIKEMREATNGKYPTFALWENVPGAFSSNKGEDFRIVLEELIKIIEPAAVMPTVPKKGWAYADSYRGDGWSLAYRVFDAQYWGVPQRRRRIYLVVDFRGGCAEQVLFEREGLRGYFTEGRTPWQEIAGHSQDRPEADDREGEIGARGANREEYKDDWCEPITGIIDNIAGQAEYGYQSEVNGTLRAGKQGAIFYAIENHPADSRVKLDDSGKYQTLTSRMGTGGGNVPMVMEEKPCPVYCLQGNGIDRADTAGCNGKGWKEDTSYTLNTIDRPAVAFDRAAFNQGQNAKYDFEISDKGINSTLLAQGPSGVAYTMNGFGDYKERGVASGLKARDYKDATDLVCENGTQYIVRRLTPTECARLQGFADRWGDITPKYDFTEEEYKFWLDVRNNHAAINGKTVKDYTKKQMLTWYNKLHTDSSKYKMWGNGIALPTALYCMQGITEALDDWKW